MAALPAEEKLDFVLQAIMTSTVFAPDFAALARQAGINTKQNAQRRLKSIVEAGGKYLLECSAKGGYAVEEAGLPGKALATPSPKKQKVPKRKKSAQENDGEVGNDGEDDKEPQRGQKW